MFLLAFDSEIGLVLSQKAQEIRRPRGRRTLEYRISELGRARLRWLRSPGSS